MRHHDIVDITIIGGGVVGGLAALRLAQTNPDLVVRVVDASSLQHRDPRTLALAHTTLLTLQQAGIEITKLADEFADIQHIHVSDRGALGSTTLHGEDYAIPTLGKVVSAQRLLDAIWDAGQDYNNLSWSRQTSIQSLDHKSEYITVEARSEPFDEAQDPESGTSPHGTAQGGQSKSSQKGAVQNHQCWRTRLLIGADGGRSFVREHLNIDRQRYDYQQVALIANVKVHEDHQGWAYERFTEQGPIALLPRGQKEFALVWCVHQNAADDIKALSDRDFLAQLQQAFGFRAGKFTQLDARASYPLHLLLAQRAVYHRTALIGNACHTLHPIAGQGYNLGVRDVVDLVTTVSAHWQSQLGLSHRALLDYEAQRRQDYQRIGGLTDGLVRVFSNQYPPLMMARSLGLLTLRKHKILSYPLARAAMGYRNLFGEA